MLEVINLEFDYPDKRLLHNVHFSVDRGNLLHLRGANGTGKTTLLKCLAGLMTPSVGEIKYQGDSISRDLAAYQQTICYVGHKSGVSQFLTVREHCHFELKRNPGFKTCDELLELFGLQDIANISCGLLSAGQRRRAGLLRLMMSPAPIWLLDEPLVALDDSSSTILMECFTEHLAKGGLIILTSHQTLPWDSEYQEYALC